MPLSRGIKLQTMQREIELKLIMTYVQGWPLVGYERHSAEVTRKSGTVAKRLNT
jgi:hypothetical protein